MLRLKFVIFQLARPFWLSNLFIVVVSFVAFYIISYVSGSVLFLSRCFNSPVWVSRLGNEAFISLVESLLEAGLAWSVPPGS